MNASILVLGTADWNQSIATNQHYMVRELAQEHDVTFLESLGLRTPEFRARDLRRIARRVGFGSNVGTQKDRPVPSGVRILSPRVIPRHVGMTAKINAALLRRLVSDWANSTGPKLLWTYSPVTYGLESLAPTVYHCVDLLGEFEGISRELIHRSERRLSANGARAAATSDVVRAHLMDMGFDAPLLWPNVADLTVIEKARERASSRTPGRVVFAGNLSRNKVDFELLHVLVRAGLDVHLAGPIAEGGGGAQDAVAQLTAEGAVYHGLLDPTSLAELYWTSSVGLIPYELNEYTRGVSPLKTYEYLAAGLAVVSTPLPSVPEVDGAVVVAASRDDFVRAVIGHAAATNSDVHSSRVLLAAGHGWASRGEQARELVRSLITSE